MKKDLITAIVVTILGVVVSFFVCNLIFGNIDGVTFKTLDTEISSDVDAPNPEVFNYRALNPTVEVYVGDCTEFSDTGECLDNNSGIVNIEDSGPAQENN